MSKRELIIALVITFIVVMLWITSDVYHARTQNITDQPSADILEPVDPNFDTSVLTQPSPSPLPVLTPPPSAPSPTPTFRPSPSFSTPVSSTSAQPSPLL